MMNRKGKTKTEASESFILCHLVTLNKIRNSLSVEKVGKLLFAALGYSDFRNKVHYTHCIVLST